MRHMLPKLGSKIIETGFSLFENRPPKRKNFNLISGKTNQNVSHTFYNRCETRKLHPPFGFFSFSPTTTTALIILAKTEEKLIVTKRYMIMWKIARLILKAFTEIEIGLTTMAMGFVCLQQERI